MSKMREIADKAYEKGAAAGKGFVGTRLGAVWGGATDVLRTGWNAAVSHISTSETPGSKGVLGIIKDTAIAIKDTLSWSSDRGLLNFSGTSLNPLGTKTWALNPFDRLRRLAAGFTETGTTLIAEGSKLILPERVGLTIEGLSKGISRAAMGVLTGDFGPYMNRAKFTRAAHAPAAA